MVSNAGPGTLTGSLNDNIPANFSTTLAQVASAVNGSASTANFSVSGGGAFAGNVTIASGGTVTVTIEVTAISTGTYTNTLTVLVPATTINLGATESAVAGTVVNVVNITPSKLVGGVTVAWHHGPDHQLHAGGASATTIG